MLMEICATATKAVTNATICPSESFMNVGFGYAAAPMRYTGCGARLQGSAPIPAARRAHDPGHGAVTGLFQRGGARGGSMGWPASPAPTNGETSCRP